jgi:low affinity Fe/Cu permease
MKAIVPRPAGDATLHNGQIGFRRFSQASAQYLGSSIAFAAASLMVVVWGIAGPFYHFSDSWELVINTGTTIVTFLMVFLIQNTQNRDALAIHLKLDELLRALEGARNSLVDLETLSDEEMARLKEEFARVSRAKSGS